MLQNLTHKNIVKYLGYSKTRENLNIFLEYVAGGSLASIISKYGCLTESVLKNYTRQILLGLEYLHWNRIVHGDLKPGNILVNKEGVCKLADFGSARFLRKQDHDSIVSTIGTLNYSAPEVLAGNESTRFSDIWSFGCVIIEVLTGKPPWHSISNQVLS